MSENPLQTWLGKCVDLSDEALLQEWKGEMAVLKLEMATV